MFSDDTALFDFNNLVFLTREEADAVYPLKTDIPNLTGDGGGIDVAYADARYAPLSGSTVYATKLEVPDVSGKADTEYVNNQLSLVTAAFDGVNNALTDKSDTTHTHASLYAPLVNPAGGINNYFGSDMVMIEGNAGLWGNRTVPSVNKANASYAPATGSTVYATKAEVTAATGGGLTQTAADDLYASKPLTYTKTEVDIALSGKQDTGSYLVAADIAGKADTATTYTKTEVDTALSDKAPATGSTVYQTKDKMVKVGSETTYYSGDKVDALLAGVSGGGGPKVLIMSGSSVYGDWSSPTTAWRRINDDPVSMFNETLLYHMPGYAGLVENRTSTTFTCLVNVQVTWPAIVGTDTRAIATVTSPGPVSYGNANIDDGRPTEPGYTAVAGQKTHAVAQYSGQNSTFPISVRSTCVLRLPPDALLSWFIKGGGPDMNPNWVVEILTF